VTSIIATGTFSKANGYGGIIVWTLPEGWLPAHASGGRSQNALMQALRKGFLVPRRHPHLPAFRDVAASPLRADRRPPRRRIGAWGRAG
jgi:hypothetical protein